VEDRIQRVVDREKKLIRDIQEARENLGIPLTELLALTDELATIWRWYRECPNVPE
jgi:hypothetical protein